MAEQFLYRTNIRAAFEQVRGKRMTEGMTTGRLLDSRLENGHLDGALQQGFHEVMGEMGGLHVWVESFTEVPITDGGARELGMKRQNNANHQEYPWMTGGEG